MPTLLAEPSLIFFAASFVHAAIYSLRLMRALLFSDAGIMLGELPISLLTITPSLLRSAALN